MYCVRISVCLFCMWTHRAGYLNTYYNTSILRYLKQLKCLHKRKDDSVSCITATPVKHSEETAIKQNEFSELILSDIQDLLVKDKIKNVCIPKKGSNI